MRRYGTLLMVLTLATASLLAAAAYSTAMVANAAIDVIVKTDVAHLAIIPNPAFADFCYLDGNVMKIDFGAGHGFQPNSSYYFQNLFYVKNNLAANQVKMGLRFDSVYPGTASMPGLHTVYASKPATGGCSSYPTCLMHNNGGITCCNWNSGASLILDPGEQVGISWSFILGNLPLGTTTWSLQVHGDALGR